MAGYLTPKGSVQTNCFFPLSWYQLLIFFPPLSLPLFLPPSLCLFLPSFLFPSWDKWQYTVRNLNFMKTQLRDSDWVNGATAFRSSFEERGRGDDRRHLPSASCLHTTHAHAHTYAPPTHTHTEGHRGRFKARNWQGEESSARGGAAWTGSPRRLDS